MMRYQLYQMIGVMTRLTQMGTCGQDLVSKCRVTLGTGHIEERNLGGGTNLTIGQSFSTNDLPICYYKPLQLSA